MEYDREKFERLEQRSIELFATARHIAEQLGEAITREATADHHLWQTIKGAGLPNSIVQAPFRSGALQLDGLRERYEADPVGFRELLERAEAWPTILQALDEHQAAARELARIQRRRQEHQAKQEAFNASFARIAAFIRRMDGSIHPGHGTIPPVTAPTLAGFQRGAN